MTTAARRVNTFGPPTLNVTVLAVLAACGEPDGTNPAEASADGWSLEEEVRIVGPPAGFGVIEAVTADDADNIYVLDRLA